MPPLCSLLRDCLFCCPVPLHILGIFYYIRYIGVVHTKNGDAWFVFFGSDGFYATAKLFRIQGKNLPVRVLVVIYDMGKR